MRSTRIRAASHSAWRLPSERVEKPVTTLLLQPFPLIPAAVASVFRCAPPSDIRVMTLPAGLDPDDVIRRDPVANKIVFLETPSAILVDIDVKLRMP